MLRPWGCALVAAPHRGDPSNLILGRKTVALMLRNQVCNDTNAGIR